MGGASPQVSVLSGPYIFQLSHSHCQRPCPRLGVGQEVPGGEAVSAQVVRAQLAAGLAVVHPTPVCSSLSHSCPGPGKTPGPGRVNTDREPSLHTTAMWGSLAGREEPSNPGRFLIGIPEGQGRGWSPTSGHPSLLECLLCLRPFWAPGPGEVPTHQGSVLCAFLTLPGAWVWGA